MIGELRPYPATKQSGLVWLGSVPEHWQVLRGKTLFGCVDIRSTTGEEELLTVSSSRGVVPRRTVSVTMFKAESYVGHKLCWPGDLVINSLWAWARGLGVSRYHGIVSTAYGVYRLRPDSNCDPRFINELVRSTSFHWELQVRSKGVWTSRLQLTDDSFLGAPFPKPPISEQGAIVRFLDHADRRIRRYIFAKQKLIKLLEEQKQAIIHRAVTRGLDSNVRLKSSGVEWLGDVPEHWEVMPLRHLLSLGPKNGVSPPSSGTGGVLSFSISAVRDGRIRIKGNEKYVDLDAALVPGFCISMGDILLVRGNGNVALVAKCGLVDEYPDNCIYPDILMKLRPNSRMASDFMVLAINSPYVSNQVLLLAKTTNGTFKVSGASVRSLVLAVPPRSEQEMILDYLLRVLADVNRARERAGNEISVLREYCTRLIADVVTGKLDVRAAVARLPEETDESEPLDDAEALAEGDEEFEAVDLDAVPEEAEA